MKMAPMGLEHTYSVE